jgi:HAMP domain-containing protein
MSRNYLIVYILVVLFASQTHAGYREMRTEIEAYEPPSILQNGNDSGRDKIETAIDTNFMEELKKIREITVKWEKSLKATDEDFSFIRPDPERLEKLHPAKFDPDKAADAMKDEYSLATLETLALLRNPGVMAAENRFLASVEMFSQVSALDEILRQYTAFTESLMPVVGPMKGKDQVRMKFPFPGVLALKGQIVGQEIKAAKESLEAARRESVTAARKTYWNLLFIHRSRRITGTTIDLLGQLEAVATTRYDAGKTSFQDVIKVRIKREAMEEELVTLGEKEKNLEAKIREILNFSHTIKMGNPEKRLPMQKRLRLDELYPLAQERRQELRRLRARVGKMERMIEMAETMILPPYTLNLSLYEDEAATQVGSIAMKETFPISVKASRGEGLPKTPWYGTNDAYLRQTRKKLQALREEQKKAEAKTTTMVRNSWFELDRASRETELYKETIVNLSQAALDVSSRGYESGRVSFADVIASYTIWLNAHLTLERKYADIGIAQAELDRVIGVSLN